MRQWPKGHPTKLNEFYKCILVPAPVLVRQTGPNLPNLLNHHLRRCLRNLKFNLNPLEDTKGQKLTRNRNFEELFRVNHNDNLQSLLPSNTAAFRCIIFWCFSWSKCCDYACDYSCCNVTCDICHSSVILSFWYCDLVVESLIQIKTILPKTLRFS